MADLQKLYEELKSVQIGPISVKEILCAAAGLKATRVSVADRERSVLEQMLPSYGLELMVSETKRGCTPDLGKGTWSNNFSGEVAADDPNGFWIIYMSTENILAARAHSFDVSTKDDLFGEVLGIPLD